MFLSLPLLALILLLSSAQVLSWPSASSRWKSNILNPSRLRASSRWETNIHNPSRQSNDGNRARRPNGFICFSDMDCQLGSHCSKTTRQCTLGKAESSASPSMCSSDRECANDKYCSRTGINIGCLPKKGHNQPCSRDNQVKPNHICHNGYAHKSCKSDSECELNEHCDVSIGDKKGYCIRLPTTATKSSSSSSSSQSSTATVGKTVPADNAAAATATAAQSANDPMANDFSNEPKSIGYKSDTASVTSMDKSYSETSSASNVESVPTWSASSESNQTSVDFTSLFYGDNANQVTNTTLNVAPSDREPSSKLPDWIIAVVVIGSLLIIIIVVVIVMRWRRNVKLAGGKGAQDKEAQQSLSSSQALNEGHDLYPYLQHSHGNHPMELYGAHPMPSPFVTHPSQSHVTPGSESGSGSDPSPPSPPNPRQHDKPPSYEASTN